MTQPKRSKYISFRLTEEQLTRIETAALDVGFHAGEWCRQVVLEQLREPQPMTKCERLLFANFVRAQYLLINGFQLLADGKLTGEEWKRLRAAAVQNAPEIARRVLSEHSHSESEGKD